ncbi:MAG: helix-turn-helix transcriptional regulator [Candidatus Lokiarchaeota archaeon]|nr:helix-turn-helix transcriptional regulator [Candidatus Harpocratesius repetitus]
MSKKESKQKSPQNQDEKSTIEEFHQILEKIPPKFATWRPMIVKMLEMQKAVNSCMQLHISDNHDHENTHLQDELKELRPGLEILQGKYTLDIIFLLNGMSFQYFNQIKENLPYINPGTLSKRLKELEKHKIIQRMVHEGSPIRVSYSITQYGKGIFQLLLPVVVFIRFHNYFKTN